MIDKIRIENHAYEQIKVPCSDVQKKMCWRPPAGAILIGIKPFDPRPSSTRIKDAGFAIRHCKDTRAEVETVEGPIFRTKLREDIQAGTEVDLFLRPEAMLIQPDPSLSDLNRFEVIVKDILFDGANSRLLAHPLDADTELLIALPQTRQFDHIQKADKIEIGWDEQSGICFPRK